MEGLCSFGNGLTAAEAAVAAVAAAAEEQGPAAPEREEEPVPQQLLLPLLGPALDPPPEPFLICRCQAHLEGVPRLAELALELRDAGAEGRGDSRVVVAAVVFAGG